MVGNFNKYDPPAEVTQKMQFNYTHPDWQKEMMWGAIHK